MPFVVTQTSTVLPVTTEYLKAHTSVSHDADDSLIEMYLKSAVAFGENITGKTFVESTFELDLDAFPPGKIALRPNLQSVSSVEYTDTDGILTALDGSSYKVKKTGLVGYIEPVDGWPSGAEDIVITFSAGYPVVDEEATTPNDLKLWLMVKVADFYAYRESVVVSYGGGANTAEMPKTFVDNMLSAHIVPGVGAGI
jgi:uncharacterized phiE125 gp8 family phage protein